MLRKSLQSPSDTIIYDLEDSVGPDQKFAARVELTDFLKVRDLQPLAYIYTMETIPGHLDS